MRRLQGLAVAFLKVLQFLRMLINQIKNISETSKINKNLLENSTSQIKPFLAEKNFTYLKKKLVLSSQVKFILSYVKSTKPGSSKRPCCHLRQLHQIAILKQ